MISIVFYVFVNIAILVFVEINKTLILKAHIDIYVKSLICLLLKDFYFCWGCVEEGYLSQALEWGR